ncbi:SMI1/KNR4 family protein [Pluralibacter gergoviae]|uniref:SMI1/KNR4 family protein n=1 Tax=Pluralibacter gergoviae TaxID=61647 RepID=UPI00090828CC|nr:SMI1/KNR4 family protein [Pluralibacter gergoviae]EKV0928897.1 SMI1/KNR4 family protein [Pluralibacter gergoviae]EKV6250008.1 SMI1/KNR4 family protein [Pluralibacter gergoviae]EKW6621648.1 SMI1/KNR4 family protein [Pluralibacter gergoviae]EKW9968176.1 SMI1/KNR4 family protein [Pluralibacter gergoviae]ELD4274402.1 SMI1/KNR4 family protein [Pluralibacter gergoviae]
MNIDINNLHPKMKLEVMNPGSTQEEVNSLISHFNTISIPSEYIDFIYKFSDAEILVNNESYIRIWGGKGCIEMNNSYNIQKYIPGALAIGDDEGGKVIFYAQGNDGYGLYLVGFGDLDINDAVFVAESLKDLLICGRGIDVLI